MPNLWVEGSISSDPEAAGSASPDSEAAGSVSPDPLGVGSVSPDGDPYRRQPLLVQAYGPGSKL